MKELTGEVVEVIETKHRGKPSTYITVIHTQARAFADYLHNKILEAKKEGKKIEITTMRRDG